MTSTPITAPDAVVRTWRAAATVASRAAHRPDDPHIVDVLRFAPREVGEMVAYMSEVLANASDLFLASATNAASGVPCPIPDPGGAAYPCECDQEGRAGCATIVAEFAPVVAGDDGCEGGAT